MPSARLPLALLAATLAVLAWSAVGPKDRFTWWLEVAPVLLAIPLIAATWRRFPLTPLLLVLAFVHALVLLVGGHYTYAEVPAGFWIRDTLGLSRNPWDRIGHFLQGFEPAILAREILLRTSPLRPGRWLFVIVCAICLAFSAFYELIEWWAAAATGEAADAFLGTQGDIWDTQWDMFLALLGALSALVLLSRVHDRQVERLPRSKSHSG
ncbi:MAG: DUF2238 domain-containing protein [Candidatus Brocadiae bacterium]|nr:DUF2238 domain-containing protein [Candidatus Brocadiia bacterium]